MPFPPPPESFTDLNFPRAGIDLAGAFSRQAPRPVAEGDYARTTPAGNNVRAFEASTNRSRGGTRPGLVKYVAAAVVADWIIQELGVVVVTSAAAKS